MKTCSICGVTKTASEFHRNRRNKDGRNNLCRPCAVAKAMAYYRANPDKKRDARLRHTYGISLDEYEAMWRRQCGLCAVCERPESEKRLAVDHDHVTGEVRGLLCQHCNHLGKFRDAPTLLTTAATYLKSAA